jgi:hypothetical protein
MLKSKRFEIHGKSEHHILTILKSEFKNFYN